MGDRSKVCRAHYFRNHGLLYQAATFFAHPMVLTYSKIWITAIIHSEILFIFSWCVFEVDFPDSGSSLLTGIWEVYSFHSDLLPTHLCCLWFGGPSSLWRAQSLDRKATFASGPIWGPIGGIVTWAMPQSFVWVGDNFGSDFISLLWEFYLANACKVPGMVLNQSQPSRKVLCLDSCSEVFILKYLRTLGGASLQFPFPIGSYELC